MRGRTLPSLPKGIRPTTEKARQTLFNWLSNDCTAMTTLDLFSGSGILSLEAISRGATSATLIDKSNAALKFQKNAFASLKLPTESVNYVLGALPRVLVDIAENRPVIGEERGWDLIFIDPPYDSELTLPTTQAVESLKLAHANSLIYLEVSSQQAKNSIPKHWIRIKESSNSTSTHLLCKLP